MKAGRKVRRYPRWLWCIPMVAASLYGESYELGRGFSLGDSLNVGGYFSTEFESSRTRDRFTADDVAVMAYGDLTPALSYLAELEAVGFYQKDFTDGNENSDRKFHIERLYGDLWVNDAFNVRFGKQITPIGYWNREPINVLRDTTSNPLYSKLLFPKFLTGIDVNGYVPGADNLNYHFFAQSTHDMDEEYINIPNTHFYGLALEKEFSWEWNGGGSVGEYIASAGGERTRFVQANLKYENEACVVTAEAIAARTAYRVGGDEDTYAGYLQGLYRFTPQHAAVARYEYYDRRHDDYRDHIGIIGYSYRPIYPVSLKGEYQWHSQNDENRFLFSFAVLF